MSTILNQKMYTNYMKEFDIQLMATRIRELRSNLNMLQKTLGEKVGVGRNTISMYESGKACPSFEVLVRLAYVLETSSDYLLGIKDFD